MHWWNRIIYFFAIHTCLSCYKSLPKEGLCWGCWRKLQLLAVDRMSLTVFQSEINLLLKIRYFFFLFFFEKKHPFLRLIYLLKYKNKPELGYIFGRVLGFLFPKGLENTVLVPVPLHPEKQAKRGYNQSEKIAQGIASITKLPIETGWVRRSENSDTQTKKKMTDRLENTYQVFKVSKMPPDHTHIILVDDVFTTGSTIEALMLCLWEKNTTLSFSAAVLSYRNLVKL
jgi:ComF family protein